MKTLLRNKTFWLFLVVLFTLPVLPGAVRVPEYWITLLNYIGLYAIVAIGLVLLTGVGGMTSFGQAAFVGVGAYATAYLTTRYGVSPWLALLVGIALTALVAQLEAADPQRRNARHPGVAAQEFEIAEQEEQADAPRDRGERQVVPLHPQRDESEHERHDKRQRDTDEQREPRRSAVARGHPRRRVRADADECRLPE